MKSTNLPLVSSEAMIKTCYEIIKEMMNPFTNIGVIINNNSRQDMIDIIRDICNEYGLTITDNLHTSLKLLNGSRLIFKMESDSFKGMTLNYCFIFDEFHQQYIDKLVPGGTKVIFRDYLVPVSETYSDCMDWTTYSQFATCESLYN